MKISNEVLKKLDISRSASEVAVGKFDRFPPLVMDRCFVDATDVLGEHLRAMARIGRSVRTEVLAMPRRGFGPRPVTISSAVARTLYSSLVNLLAEEIDLQPRDDRQWKNHDAFGVPQDASDENYIVDIDIASCYEYIEHEALAHQLAMKSSEIDVINSLMELLAELMGRTRGLPQLSAQSDLLADVYLQVLERQIARRGFPVSRIADDFRIITPSWIAANSVIENIAESARNLGLVLSTEKTNIRKSITVLGGDQEEAQFLNEHFDAASSSTVDFFMNPYEDPEEVEIPAGEEAVLLDAFWRIIHEWYDLSPSDGVLHTKHLASALSILRDHEDRVGDKILKEIVFRLPIRLDSVCRYILGRTSEVRSNWATLQVLLNMGRQSAWAKLWILHTADQMEMPDRPISARILRWITLQLEDRHEVVRSEAAWVLGGMKKIDQQTLSNLFGKASGMTRPAIAAATGRLGVKSSSQVVVSMFGDSRIIRPAFVWGAQNDKQ